jgi:hypothetical protein
MIIWRHGRVRLRRTLLALFAALLLIASLSWLPHARAEQPPAPFEPVVASEGATAEERTEKGQDETGSQRPRLQQRPRTDRHSRGSRPFRILTEAEPLSIKLSSTDSGFPQIFTQEAQGSLH